MIVKLGKSAATSGTPVLKYFLAHSTYSPSEIRASAVFG